MSEVQDLCWKKYTRRFSSRLSASTHRRQHPKAQRLCFPDSQEFSSDERNTYVTRDKADINGFGINS